MGCPADEWTMKKRILWPHGFSLIEIVLALGLLSLLLMLLTSGMSGMQRAGKMTEGGERCRALANVINAQIQRGAGSAFISNIGATDLTDRYEAGAVNLIIDPLFNSNRYLPTSGGTPARAIVSSSSEPQGQLHDLTFDEELDLSNHPASSDWAFTNYLNIANSANGIIAAINQEQISCVAGLAERGSDVTPLFDDLLAEELNRQGLNVEMFMAADVVMRGGSLCASAGSTSINLETLEPSNTHVDYRISINVETSSGSSDGADVQSCSVQGRVAFSPDRDPPLTAVRILGAEQEGGSLCGNTPSGEPKQGVPSICAAPDDPAQIELEVVTFKNTAVCRSCLHEQYELIGGPSAVITRAMSLNGTCAEPRDPIGTCVETNRCEYTDPGSLFFCRLGEKHWLAGLAGGGDSGRDWQPCHAANLWDYDGTVISEANVFMEYGTTHPIRTNPARGNYGAERDYSQSDLATWARIRIANPRRGRSYQFDVRAVDTSSRWMGRSFCGSDANNFTCSPNSAYGVAVAELEDTSYPTFNDSPWSLNSKIAFPTQRPTGQQDYDPLLFAAFDNVGQRAQCEPGDFEIVQAVTNYLGTAPGLPRPSGMGIETCTMNLEMNGGASPTPFACACNNNGTCLGDGDTPAVTARFNATFLSGNECASTQQPTIGNFEWCQDLEPSFDISRGSEKFRLGNFSHPRDIDLSPTVRSPAEVGKSICGLSYAVPNAPDEWTAEPGDGKGRFNYEYRAEFGLVTLPANMNVGGTPNLKTVGGCQSWGVMDDDWHESFGGHQIRVQAIDSCGRWSQNHSQYTTYGLFTAASEEGDLTPAVVRRNSNLSPDVPFEFWEGNECDEGLYAGCNEAVGQYRCWPREGAGSCVHRGASCHSNWADSFSPTESQVCHDPRVDNFWASLSVADRRSIAGQRCGTTYRCVDHSGATYSPQPGGCNSSGFQAPCTLAGQCNSPSPTPGNCSGGEKNGESCWNNGDCTVDPLDPSKNGTCSGPNPTAGKCQHNGANCWSNDQCSVSDGGVNIRCAVDEPGTCECSSDLDCGTDGEVFAGGFSEGRFCYRLFGGVHDGLREKKATSQCVLKADGTGEWYHFYCRYGTQQDDGSWTTEISDLPSAIDADAIKSFSPSTTGNKWCVRVTLNDDPCDPNVDSFKKAPGS